MRGRFEGYVIYKTRTDAIEKKPKQIIRGLFHKKDLDCESFEKMIVYTSGIKLIIVYKCVFAFEVPSKSFVHVKNFIDGAKKKLYHSVRLNNLVIAQIRFAENVEEISSKYFI